VAFESTSNNLVSGDTNEVKDLFVRDRQTGSTERVSVASDGTQADDSCGYSACSLSISSDGRFVAFHSMASNLVSGDTNGWTDVFVHDRQTGETTCVSTGINGAQGNNISENPFISADGRYVAFDSIASNLVLGDSVYYYDAFVHDRQTGVTTQVSINHDGIEGNGYSQNPKISTNMQWVAFRSSASNLVTGDTNEYLDIFEAEWVPQLPVTEIFLPVVVK
jgi:Tol biopolymer transport system component